MSDKVTVTLAPFEVKPAGKKPSLPELIWMAVKDYVWFGVGILVGYLIAGMR